MGSVAVGASRQLCAFGSSGMVSVSMCEASNEQTLFFIPVAEQVAGLVTVQLPHWWAWAVSISVGCSQAVKTNTRTMAIKLRRGVLYGFMG